MKDASKLPQRKATRLKYFDYDSNNAYFITICTLKRQNILSEIVLGNNLHTSQVFLSDIGKIVEKHIHDLEINPRIKIDNYVIMPNHIHLLISANKYDNGTSSTPSPANAVLPYIVSTFKRLCNKEIGGNIFQRSFHDHIIRNDNDYSKIWDYIETNPITWELDSFYKSM